MLYTNPNFIQLLWHYGYLTIDEEREKQVILRYPNEEVQTQIENIKIALYRKFMPPEKQLRKEIAKILLLIKIYKILQNKYAYIITIILKSYQKVTSRIIFQSFQRDWFEFQCRESAQNRKRDLRYIY